MTGQEERDALFARLFGLTAVIRSGLIVRQKSLPTSASSETVASSLAGFTEIISHLIQLGNVKSWLRESAWWTVLLAIDTLHSSNTPWKQEAAKSTATTIFIDNKSWYPEKVAVALKMQMLFPEFPWKDYLSLTFKNPDILSTSNLSALARILKVSVDVLRMIIINRHPGLGFFGG
jgi:DNA polymerase phi